MNLDGKVAIVTGASHGLGRATARRIVDAGGRVVLADIDVGPGEEAAAAIGNQARFHLLDVWDEDHWRATLAFTEEQFGGFDILVNNAARPCNVPIDQATKEDWLRTFETNAGGVFLGCRFAVLAMKDRGGGAIVNVSSNSTVAAMETVALYSSSKGAVNVLTRAVAARCLRARWPIRCNTVIPGGMVSKMCRDTFLEMANIDIAADTNEARAVLEAQNIVDPVEVADIIVFLASDAARRLNGVEIVADGGDTMIFGRIN